MGNQWQCIKCGNLVDMGFVDCPKCRGGRMGIGIDWGRKPNVKKEIKGKERMPTINQGKIVGEVK